MTTNKSFVIIVPSFNNAAFCRRNLASILSQDYASYRVIYIDDASTDDTARLVSEELAASPQGHRVKFIRNATRVGAVANTDRAVRTCSPQEVIVLVDGDDQLAHERVLSRLNVIYRDPAVWLTYGQHTYYPHGGYGFCAQVPNEIVGASAFRDYRFVSSHLRTFYATLWQRIEIRDLQFEGRFYDTGGDIAFMMAMLEMAGTRSRFIPEVLYLYNRANPINDDKVDRARQRASEFQIRDRDRYGRLSRLDAPARKHDVYFVTRSGDLPFASPDDDPEAGHLRRTFRHLRSVLNRLGYTVRHTHTLNGHENAHRIFVFGAAASFARQSTDVGLRFVLWNHPASCDDPDIPGRTLTLPYPGLRPVVGQSLPFEQRDLLAPSLPEDRSPRELRLRASRFALCDLGPRTGIESGMQQVFDSFAAGCVPVCAASSGLERWVPRECFIALEDFATEEDLSAWLSEMTRETHGRYISAISKFLASEEALAHSPENFIRAMVRDVHEPSTPEASAVR